MNIDHFFSLDRPLHNLPAPSQMRAANLGNFDRLVGELGGNGEEILARHGLESSAIAQAEQFVDCRSVVEMFEFCAATFNDPLFGLHLAQLQEPDVYGSVTALCRSAPNLREAINGLIDYIPLIHSSETLLELVEGEKIAEFRWSERSDMGINEQANYHGLLLNLKVLRMLAGSGFQPAYVSFPVEMFRRAMPDLAQMVGCPVRVTTGRGCIAFSSSLLDVPVSSGNAPVYQLLSGYMARLKSSTRPRLGDEVANYIRDNLTRGDVSIEACAQQLGISARTLQSRLKLEGSSYSDLLDRQRLVRARYFLKHNHLSIAEIADTLGYAERTSFGRAFKRWTGLSPRQFREYASH